MGLYGADPRGAESDGGSMSGAKHYGPDRIKRGAVMTDPRTCQYKASAGDREAVRFELYAEELLEKVLRRQRWSAADRDAIAVFLERVVRRERRGSVIGGEE